MSELEWHIGDVIQKIRENRGMTRAKLAKRAGVTPYWMGRLEKTGRCQVNTLERIAAALRVKTGDIYNAVPMPGPHPLGECYEILVRAMQSGWADSITLLLEALETCIDAKPDGPMRARVEQLIAPRMRPRA